MAWAVALGGLEQPDAEGAKVTQRTQKETKKIWLFLCVLCVLLRPLRPAVRLPAVQLVAFCRAAIRSSIGGWVENSLPTPDVMPNAWMLFGSSPGTMPPSRASALIIGWLRPSSRTEPRSARNSPC